MILIVVMATLCCDMINMLVSDSLWIPDGSRSLVVISVVLTDVMMLRQTKRNMVLSGLYDCRNIGIRAIDLVVLV